MTYPATRIMYVEHKVAGDSGSARICRVRFSKSGRTLYVGALQLQRCIGGGIRGNYFETSTGTEYWVSGPKRNGEDRHWAGSGKVQIDSDVAEEYWRDIRQCEQPNHPLIT